MAQYVLMLRDNGTYGSLSPEELQKIFGRFRTWSDKLRAQGKITGGQKLKDRAGRVMRRNGAKDAVTDGPFAEAKEIIGGFFVVDAKSYDEAQSLASGCPHLDFGSIEIREIDPMTGNA
ncbi:MAG TPA: YciI family protein [Thermoanaerobaculia bacterium]|nr:YciI family protein [Thermoanaerobaculia bacterium]